MFDQFTKSFQSMSANPFVAAAAEAGQKAQESLTKLVANATEYAKLEAGHAIAFAQIRKPEDVMETLMKSAQARQAYFTQKSKEAFDTISGISSDLAKSVEIKGSQFVDQTHGAIDAAFAGAKQGLGVAESAMKNAVSKSGVKRKA